ncbi:amino acid kinase family protein [Inquilinus sp. OTU3971]|uniref:amino acid kinase family protein n=1 Tax=Inquilinus sp. OTU3971 TaxID=3043855 RepID=UPI00313BA5E4
MIGYLIEQELSNLLQGKAIATLLTQTRVDPKDPAFSRPTKPIGPIYDEATARRISAARGWRIARDGTAWRRVVPSPAPIELLEARVIALLVDREVAVICAGGGGIPVIERPDGSLAGVGAVVDKDFASALLARQLKAELLLMLTDVDAVNLGYGTPAARAIRRATPSDLAAEDFPAGSMGPKIAAAKEFALGTGRPAAIGRLDDALQIVRGEQVTWIDVPGPAEDRPRER